MKTKPLTCLLSLPFLFLFSCAANLNSTTVSSIAIAPVELGSSVHILLPDPMIESKKVQEYLRNELNCSTDIKYNGFGPVHPWDRENDNTRDNLREAMAQNPYLKVLIQSGYYDGATTYFQAKYTMWQVDPSGKMKDRFFFKGYRSGHMMYLRSEDLKSSNQDLRNFIKNSLTEGKAAKY